LLPCCEESNKYKIFATDGQFENTGVELGEFVEKSSFLCRCCCIMNRAYAGTLIVGGTESDMESSYKCRCLSPLCTWPCMRPEMSVNMKFEGQSGPIGRITVPYYCPLIGRYSYSINEMNVWDKSGNLTYMIQGTCYQKGFCCMYCRIGCPHIDYEITDPTKKVVGRIKNIYNGCFKDWCTRADKFGVEFPDNIDLERKTLLLHAAIWLDYLHYAA